VIGKQETFSAKKTTFFGDNQSYTVASADGRCFTVVVPRTQATTHPDSDVERWCELHRRQLPDEGGSIEIDLNEVRRQ
jgi:hypothetical protein